VEHELALIKVRASNANRAEVLKVVELYKGRILDIGSDTVIVEHSGTVQEIDSLVALLGGFGVREMVRTGSVAMSRGSSVVDIESILRTGTVPVAPATTMPEEGTR
jgi:acetolactate synthase-1/3 small subunit